MKKNQKNNNALLIFLLCHRRPIIGILSSTRSLQNTGKWVFWAYACSGGEGSIQFILEKKMHTLFFWKFCHHWPILRIRSSTRGLHDLRKWVFWDATDRHTDIATQWLNRPRGQFSEIIWICIKGGWVVGGGQGVDCANGEWTFCVTFSLRKLWSLKSQLGAVCLWCQPPNSDLYWPREERGRHIFLIKFRGWSDVISEQNPYLIPLPSQKLFFSLKNVTFHTQV